MISFISQKAASKEDLKEVGDSSGGTTRKHQMNGIEKHFAKIKIS
jgi:hypothetical protein